MLKKYVLHFVDPLSLECHILFEWPLMKWRKFEMLLNLDKIKKTKFDWIGPNFLLSLISSFRKAGMMAYHRYKVHGIEGNLDAITCKECKKMFSSEDQMK